MTTAQSPAAVARHPGSARDIGPFLNVITWILLVTSGLAVLTRLVTKRALRRRIDVDDAFVVAALVTSIGSGIAVCIQTANGLGSDWASLAEHEVVAYEKGEYANKLLYIATLAFAKLSIISLLMLLTASDLHRKAGRSLAAFIAVWGLVSEFVAAFQCGKEQWDAFREPHHCYDISAFWRATGILNMFTDLALILFPLHVILILQMSTGKKFTILVFFGARSFDIVATGVQLAYTSSFSSHNPTQDLWKWTILTQVIQCITILTSCVPYLRPLLESLPSGLYGADELRRRGTPSATAYVRSKDESYKLSNTSSTSGKTRRKSQRDSVIKRFMPTLSDNVTSHSNSASGLPGGPRRPDGEQDVEIVAEGRCEGGQWETDSTGSQAKIIKTTVVSAAWEEAERKSRETRKGSEASEMEIERIT